MNAYEKSVQAVDQLEEKGHAEWVIKSSGYFCFTEEGAAVLRADNKNVSEEDLPRVNQVIQIKPDGSWFTDDTGDTEDDYDECESCGILGGPDIGYGHMSWCPERN